MAPISEAIRRRLRLGRQKECDEDTVIRFGFHGRKDVTLLENMSAVQAREVDIAQEKGKIYGAP